MRSLFIARAHELLKRVVAAGKADRFRFADVCPRDGSLFLTALAALVESELIQRVPVGCGVWWYRLTPAGVDAAKAKGPPRLTHWSEE